jgi:hypothetical protein
MDENIDDFTLVLGLWQANYLSEAAVIAWADRKLRASPEPALSLIELALHGPRHCLKDPWADFPKPAKLSFMQLFALRAHAVDLASDQDLGDFMHWLIGAGIGEDFNALPAALLAYQLDHYVSDCDDRALALQTLKESLPGLLQSSQSMFEEMAAMLPGYMLKPVQPQQPLQHH